MLMLLQNIKNEKCNLNAKFMLVSKAKIQSNYLYIYFF